MHRKKIKTTNSPLRLSEEWLRFSLSGSDVGVTLGQGADGKASNPRKLESTWRRRAHIGDLFVLYSVKCRWIVDTECFSRRKNMRMFRVVWYIRFWWIACCPQHQSPTAQATGHWSKVTFHYTQRAPPTVHPFTPLKQMFHNVPYISSEVDSVNDYYAIYRRYKMDLLPLHINMDTWHLCKVSPSDKLAVGYRHLKEIKNRQRWKTSSVKQFFKKKKKTLWTNKRAWIHFFC